MRNFMFKLRRMRWIEHVTCLARSKVVSKIDKKIILKLFIEKMVL